MSAKTPEWFKTFKANVQAIADHTDAEDACQEAAHAVRVAQAEVERRTIDMGPSQDTLIASQLALVAAQNKTTDAANVVAQTSMALDQAKYRVAQDLRAKR